MSYPFRSTAAFLGLVEPEPAPEPTAPALPEPDDEQPAPVAMHYAGTRTTRVRRIHL